MADEIKTDVSLPDVPAKDVEEAKLEGVKQAIADSAAQQFKTTDGSAVTEEAGSVITPTYDVFQLQDKLDLDPKELKAWLNGESGQEGFTPSQGQIAGLLEVERSGKNRTDVVEALVKHLGIKSPYEVTDAGPNYTNDVSRAVLKR